MARGRTWEGLMSWGGDCCRPPPAPPWDVGTFWPQMGEEGDEVLPLCQAKRAGSQAWVLPLQTPFLMGSHGSRINNQWLFEVPEPKRQGKPAGISRSPGTLVGDGPSLQPGVGGCPEWLSLLWPLLPVLPQGPGQFLLLGFPHGQADV